MYNNRRKKREGRGRWLRRDAALTVAVEFDPAEMATVAPGEGMGLMGEVLVVDEAARARTMG